MALHLIKEYDNGFIGNYWRLATPNLGTPKSATLILFKDATHAHTGKPEFARISVKLPGDGLTKAAIIAAAAETPAKCLYTLAYTLIKTSQLDNEGNETNPFVLAIDV